MVGKFGIGWQVGGTTGWGVYGLALTMQGARRGLLPVPVYVSPKFAPDPLEERALAPLRRRWFVEQQFFALGEETARAGYPFLMGLGNDLSVADPIAHIRGEPDIGVVFFEHRNIPAADVARARERFSGMVAGSSWNAGALRGMGFSNVVFCPQGIDPTRFHPAPKSGVLADRFVIFSGGKLEFRKGQDIAVEAFRRFHARHPEALLICAWHNHWDQSVASLSLSPYRLGRPRRAENGPWRMIEWLTGLGIPADAVLDLGEVAHAHMPRLLRECDVGLFPNRCEGGTNLVAMECMACGVPAILSRNTGHLDLLARDGAAIPLAAQGAVKGGAADDPELFFDWGGKATPRKSSNAWNGSMPTVPRRRRSVAPGRSSWANGPGRRRSTPSSPPSAGGRTRLGSAPNPGPRWGLGPQTPFPFFAAIAAIDRHAA